MSCGSLESSEGRHPLRVFEETDNSCSLDRLDSSLATVPLSALLLRSLQHVLGVCAQRMDYISTSLVKLENCLGIVPLILLLNTDLQVTVGSTARPTVQSAECCEAGQLVGKGATEVHALQVTATPSAQPA